MAKTQLIVVAALMLLAFAAAQEDKASEPTVQRGGRPRWYRRPIYPTVPTNTAWTASLTGLWRVTPAGVAGAPTALISFITSGNTVAATGVVQEGAGANTPVTGAGSYVNNIPAGGDRWIWRGYAVYRVVLSGLVGAGTDGVFNIVLTDANMFMGFPGNTSIPSPPTAAGAAFTGARAFNL